MPDSQTFTVALTFRPGQQSYDDWHARVDWGDKSYVGLSRFRGLACVKAGLLIRRMILDAERPPRLPVSGLVEGEETE